MLGIGWYFSRRNASSEDYLLGNRDMKSSSFGLSLFATLFSTITYLALPGELINKGPVILCWIFGMPLVYGVVGYVLIPPFMKVRVTSAYEILEQRLGLSVRLVGSCRVSPASGASATAASASAPRVSFCASVRPPAPSGRAAVTLTL